MAWLLHPDDFAKIKEKFGSSMGLPLGIAYTVDVVVGATIKRGHIFDSDHPEIGMPTFAEFPERYRKALDDDRRKFDESAAKLMRFMNPIKAQGEGQS